MMHARAAADYERADKGTCSGVGGWISSVDKCAVAAADLGLTTNTPINVFVASNPHGCYLKGKELFWNPVGDKQYKMTDAIRYSLCTTGESACRRCTPTCASTPRGPCMRSRRFGLAHAAQQRRGTALRPWAW